MNLETSSKNISQCALKRERKRGYADIVKGRFFPLQWCAVRSSKSSKNLSTFFNYSKHKKTLRIIHWIPDRFSFYSRFFVPKSNFRIYKKKRKMLFLSSRPYGIIFVTTSQLNDESELCVCNVPYKDDVFSNRSRAKWPPSWIDCPLEIVRLLKNELVKLTALSNQPAFLNGAKNWNRK